MDREEKLNYIRSRLTRADLFAQLAEEASELSQAASKMARYYNDRNTPANDYDVLVMSLVEEHADVATAFEALNWNDKEMRAEISEHKIDRWYKRLTERQINTSFSDSWTTLHSSEESEEEKPTHGRFTWGGEHRTPKHICVHLCDHSDAKAFVDALSKATGLELTFSMD